MDDDAAAAAKRRFLRASPDYGYADARAVRETPRHGGLGRQIRAERLSPMSTWGPSRHWDYSNSFTPLWIDAVLLSTASSGFKIWPCGKGMPRTVSPFCNDSRETLI